MKGGRGCQDIAASPRTTTERHAGQESRPYRHHECADDDYEYDYDGDEVCGDGVGGVERCAELKNRMTDHPSRSHFERSGDIPARDTVLGK